MTKLEADDPRPIFSTMCAGGLPAEARAAHTAAMRDDKIFGLTAATLAHYEAHALSFWEGTRDHDVSQNRAALIAALEGAGPFAILDLGCGPGRDLAAFRAEGHIPVGLDGSARFVEMARQHSGCEVLHQDFLRLELGAARFDGIFANASLRLLLVARDVAGASDRRWVRRDRALLSPGGPAARAAALARDGLAQALTSARSAWGAS
jgi:SAM-dependent methyltransferase